MAPTFKEVNAHCRDLRAYGWEVPAWLAHLRQELSPKRQTEIAAELDAERQRKIAHADVLKRLDERTAKGISPTNVLGPDGIYRPCNSADDAFWIGMGRPDLAIG